MSENLVVVIPSFNSAPFIVKLVKEILAQKNILRVIVVDDNSPDKTSDLVRKRFSRNKKVKLIVRMGKDGRGSAVIAGFKEGLKDKKGKFFIEMDSDYAHDPKYIPKLLEKIEECDMVIGSRYINKGKTVNYEYKRRVFSFLANLAAYLFLGVKITDYTSGFRCYRRELLEKIKLGTLKTKGFITLSEMAYKAHKNGFEIKEIPVTVRYHPRYKSNLDLAEIVDAFVALFVIRFG